MRQQQQTIQIPTDLFKQLCRYHLLDDRSDQLAHDIAAGLQKKLDAAVRREIYTASKTDPDPVAREKARQGYLDLVGLPTDYRW